MLSPLMERASLMMQRPSPYNLMLGFSPMSLHHEERRAAPTTGA